MSILNKYSKKYLSDPFFTIISVCSLDIHKGMIFIEAES